MALPDFIVASDGNGHSAGALRPSTGAVVKVISATTHAVSAVLSHDLIQVTATVACYVDIGAAPEAGPATMYLPPDVPHLFHIDNGVDKLSAERLTVDGVVFIVPMK